MTLQPRPSGFLAEWWIIGLLTAMLIGVAWVRMNYPRRLSELFESLVNIRLMRQTMREELVLSHRASVTLSSIFLFAFPVLMYLSLKFFKINALGEANIMLFLKLILLVFLIYLCKVMVIRTVQWIGAGDFGLTEYMHNLFLTNKTVGILLIPILMFATMSSVANSFYFLISGGLIFGVFYTFRLGRGVANAVSLHIPPLYIILYLCTLEILPLLLFYKLVSSY